MELIIYTDKCASCAYKQEWQAVKHFAKANKLVVRQKNVLRNKEWFDEAMRYEIELPFAVLNGNAIRLTEPLERLL